MDGLLVLNKPTGITSRDAVDRAEQWFPGVRIGHAGTLDPLARGVLVLCFGVATRLIEYVQQMGKTYHAGIRLGARSDTDDADGVIQPVEGPPVPTDEQARTCLQTFVGAIDQLPPAHSAAKVQGRRAYDLARAGKRVDLTPRRIQIYRIDVIKYAFPRLDVVVDCGKGTYIRSLARDLGDRLGCGGLIEALERTRIGPFGLENAVDLEARREEAVARLLPVEAAIAELPRVALTAAELSRLRQGQRLTLPRQRQPSQTGETAVVDEAGRLVALAVWQASEGVLAPKKVLG